ncbi:MAG TPA: TlpA disulfide reductase family protein [Saprospiraceae bacterium]|nr:TlpA disulfide reductase family protein [Saprospiraceae bacterium]
MKFGYLSVFLLFGANFLFGQVTAKPLVEVIHLKELLQLTEQKDDTFRVFNFWATWCRPCVAELPYFEKLNQKPPHSKYRQYLVSLDFKEQLKKKLLPFIESRDIKTPVLLLDETNPDYWINQLEPSWSGAIPATLFTYQGQRWFEESSYESEAELRDSIQFYKNQSK